MGFSGTRRATLPVLAVTRRGRRVPALTTMVSGPGQNRSARRSNAESISRARPYACAVSLMSRERGLWRAVKGVGGQGDYAAGGERADDLSDQLRLWLVRVDEEYLGRQRILLCEGLKLRCEVEQRKSIAYLRRRLRCGRCSTGVDSGLASGGRKRHTVG
jgi:hypothetical protein